MKLWSYSIAVAISLIVSFSSYSSAEVKFTSSEIKSMLGRWPGANSEAGKKDFQTLWQLQETRTTEECEIAASEPRGQVKTMFVQEGLLTLEEAETVWPTVKMVYSNAVANSGYAKSIYKRPRPYLTDDNLEPCVELEKSYAFPSGHTTSSRAIARVLGDLFPDRAEGFIHHADQVAYRRVLAGVHHPTDIVAGKVLGDAVAEKILEGFAP